MATLRLKPGNSTRCAEGLVTVDWRVLGAPSTDVVLKVTQTVGGALAVAVSTTGAAQVLIAAVPVAVDLCARPAGGGTFGNGVQISAQLTLRTGGVDAGQYLLPVADVSGTTVTTLLNLSPHSGYFQLDVPADLASPRTSPSPARSASVPPAPQQREPRVATTPPTLNAGPLHGLAQDAAYAARRRLGAARLPGSALGELHLAIDRSASVLPLVRDGSGQAVLDLLLGVNDVVGSASDIALWTLGTVPSRLRRTLSRATADGLWDAEVGQTATTGGTLVAPLVAHTTTDARTRRTVIVVTDGPPADLADLTVALRQARASGSGARWHVLALARSMDDPQVRLEPWRDELHCLLPLVREGLLSCSAVTPSGEEGWLSSALEDVETLERVIDSLPFWSAS